MLHSQQGIMLSNYSDNLVLYNPSYIGNTDNILLVGGYRSQWSNIKDAPTDYIFSYSQPIGASNSSFGLNFNLDKLGPMSNYNLYGNYAYRFITNDDDFIQLGLRAGMDFGVVNNRALDGYWKGDPNFREENVNYRKPVFGFGLNYTTSLFSIGASVPDLIPGVYEITSYSESFRTALKFSGNELNLNKYKNTKFYGFTHSELSWVNDYYLNKMNNIICLNNITKKNHIINHLLISIKLNLFGEKLLSIICSSDSLFFSFKVIVFSSIINSLFLFSSFFS
jgi:hypothetical protein